MIRENTDGFGNALNVVAKNLPVAFSTTLSETLHDDNSGEHIEESMGGRQVAANLATFAASRHDD